ncbi:MAG: PGF-CTERM sorting domain-containing protein [Halobacteriales archaeon]|nr:PGF-CTERM sorting domain-containing protein [Halobacteriales archaeon]
MQLWTAADLPTDADAGAVSETHSNSGAITQDSSIAYQDEVVHQIGVSGIYGVLTAEMEAEGVDAEQALLNLVNEGTLSISAMQAGNFPNADPLTVDFAQTNANGGLNVVADSANNTVFVALDTTNVAFERGGNDVTPDAENLYGQAFDVEFAVNASTALVDGDEDETVTASFSVEERMAELNGGNDITVEAACGQTISGTTERRTGFAKSVSAHARRGRSAFLKTAQRCRRRIDDGTFSAVRSTSRTLSQNTTFTVTASARARQFADGDVGVDGTVVEVAATPTPEPTTATPEPTTATPEPATATPTPEPATATPTDGGDGPTETATETTGSTPGFGGAVAIVALAGAALIALRRDN